MRKNAHGVQSILLFGLAAYTMMRVKVQLVTLENGVSSSERPRNRIDPYPLFLTLLSAVRIVHYV